MDNEPPQTEAIEEDPLDSVISDTTRMVYGKSVAAGKTACKARSLTAMRDFGDDAEAIEEVATGRRGRVHERRTEEVGDAPSRRPHKSLRRGGIPQ